MNIETVVKLLTTHLFNEQKSEIEAQILEAIQKESRYTYDGDVFFVHRSASGKLILTEKSIIESIIEPYLLKDKSKEDMVALMRKQENSGEEEEIEDIDDSENVENDDNMIALMQKQETSGEEENLEDIDDGENIENDDNTDNKNVISVSDISELNPASIKQGVKYNIGEIKGLTWLDYDDESKCIKLGYNRDSDMREKLIKFIKDACPVMEKISSCGEGLEAEYFLSNTYLKDIREMDEGENAYKYWLKNCDKIASIDYELDDNIKIRIFASGEMHVINKNEITCKIGGMYRLFRIEFPEGTERLSKDVKYFNNLYLPIFYIPYSDYKRYIKDNRRKKIIPVP